MSKLFCCIPGRQDNLRIFLTYLYFFNTQIVEISEAQQIWNCQIIMLCALMKRRTTMNAHGDPLSSDFIIYALSSESWPEYGLVEYTIKRPHTNRFLLAEE